MRHFKEFFKFEANRFTCKRNLVVFGVLLAIMLVVTQFGINIYKFRADKKKEMLDLEKKRVEGFINYRMYGSYGFRMALAPSPMNIFFINTAPFGDMTSVIDTSERLKVYNLLQSDSAFVVKTKWFSDFSMILLLLGSLIAFFYGFEAYQNTEYMKFLSSFSSSRRVFINIALSRLLLLSLLVFVSMLLSYLLVIINGIRLPLTWVMGAFFLETVVMMSGFFGLGCWLGLTRSKVTGVLLGLGIWITAIIIPPLIIDMITNLKGNMLTSVYKIEDQKFKLLKDFEQRAKNEKVTLELEQKPDEIHRIKMESFWENEFKEIQALDDALIKQMEGNISDFQSISMLFPTTQYLAVNYEISSSGYQTLLEFYRTIKQRKTGFMRKFIDTSYVQENINGKVEPYLKDKEPLFFSEPYLVFTFLGGLLISIFYFIGTMIGANRAYNKALFRLEPGEEYKVKETITLESGLISSFHILGDLFGRQLFTLMMGKCRYIAKNGCKLDISLDGIDIADNPERLDFHYFTHIRNIPGEIRVGSLLSLLTALSNIEKKQREQILKISMSRAVLKKSLKEMNDDELGKVFLVMLDIGSPAVYVLNKVIPWISREFAIVFESRLFALADNENKSVVFLWEDLSSSPYRGDSHSFARNAEWLNTVAFYKKLSKAEASETPQKSDGKE